MLEPEGDTVRERLVRAALELFEEVGYDATTTEAIARRAGVGRTTFFRTFASKEDAIFPHHDPLLADVERRLRTGSAATAETALTEASRLVLAHYLEEGDIARARYRLTSSVDALRAREIAGISSYQRLFARYLLAWFPDAAEAALRSELTAANVVTAHNHVLRAWLRHATETPVEDLDRAMAVALDGLHGLVGSGQERPGDGETAVVVLRSAHHSVDEIVAALQRLDP